uniref:catechol O-methyltransferase domain-containing protein 1 isoform X1 n=1 Tax=Macaca mulatta TaxID=9544 RepID=UPI0010A27ACF|nr:catechol O-methyltransferase domain-containing protein 1 isoform X1 [Macaca mulatta]
MMPETTAPRAVPRQGGARRARESETCPRSSSARDLPLPPAASCPRHDPAGAPALRARRAGPGLSRAGRGLRHWPLPGKAVPPMARPARAVPASPRGQPAVAVSSEPLHAGAPGAAKPEAADPGAAAGGFHDDLRAGPALGQPGAAHPGQEGAGSGHLHGLLCPGPGPGAARRRARGDLRGGSAAPGAGTAPVEAGRGGAQDRPPAEARPADPGRTAGGGRGRHLRRGRGGCGQGELRCLLRALPAAAATRRHPRRPQSKGSTAGEEKAPSRGGSPSFSLTPLIPQSPTQSSHIGSTPCGAPAPVGTQAFLRFGSLSPALVTSRPGTSLRGPASCLGTSLRGPAFRPSTSL